MFSKTLVCKWLILSLIYAIGVAALSIYVYGEVFYLKCLFSSFGAGFIVTFFLDSRTPPKRKGKNDFDFKSIGNSTKKGDPDIRLHR